MPTFYFLIWNHLFYNTYLLGDNKTEVTRILHFDDGGNIPTMFFLQNSYISIFAEELKKMKAHLMAKEIEQNPSRFDTSPRDNMNISLEKIKKKEPKEKKPQITDDFGEKVLLYYAFLINTNPLLYTSINLHSFPSFLLFCFLSLLS